MSFVIILSVSIDGLRGATKALLDAGMSSPLNILYHYVTASVVHATGITYYAVEAAFVGYVYDESTCGPASLYSSA
jgi:hypothetical protein